MSVDLRNICKIVSATVRNQKKMVGQSCCRHQGYEEKGEEERPFHYAPPAREGMLHPSGRISYIEAWVPLCLASGQKVEIGIIRTGGATKYQPKSVDETITLTTELTRSPA